MRHFDGVGVPELVRREPATHTDCSRDAPQLFAGGGLLPMATCCRSVNDAQQRANRELTTYLYPRFQLRPGPAIHTHFPAPAACAIANEDGTAGRIEVGLCEI